MASLATVNLYAQKSSISLSPKELAFSGQQQVEILDDPLGRSTPQGTLLGFMKYAERENYDRAIEFLNTKQPPRRARELASQLQRILNKGFSGNFTKLSNKPEGNLVDGLKPNREKIGTAETSSGSHDIILERVQNGEEPAVWLFSSETLKLVPEIYRDIEYDLIERYIPESIQNYKLFEYPLWQWIGLLLVIPLSFLLAWFINWLLLVFERFRLQRFATTTQNKQRIRRLKGPIRVLSLSLGFFLASFLSYSLLSRLFWLHVSQTLAIAGITWICLQITNPIVEILWSRKQIARSSGKIAIARLVQKIIKATIVIVGTVSIFYIAGINLTAVLTGLGIGGIAVAFAAQKTLENLFGGVMIISDQSVRVGDFCRGGDYTGTVEDIGLRSTKIRTINRTVVSIPNGQLATMSLENFTVRDKILFRHNIQLRYETSADQLRFVIAGMRRLLYENPKIETASVRVRFTGFKDSGLELESFAYIIETDYLSFLAIQEDILLRFMSLIEESGTSFAFPSHTIYISGDTGLDKEKSNNAEENVRKWREQGALPFPDFRDEDINKFTGRSE